MAWPVLVAGLPMSVSYAQSLPSGASVSAGNVTIKTPGAGALLVQQQSQRAVVKWQDFSIAKGSSVTFAQPNVNAATLNVVTGNQLSDLSGSLKANGSVFLINQNGIAVGASGVVDTKAGFIASTLSMDEDAFMKGKNVFSGKGGAVRNQGQISTGDGGAVVLLGSSVSNEGVINAPLGKVALASGSAATLDLNGDGFLQVLLPADASGADGRALVSNSGAIQADGGSVLLTAATVRQAVREAVYMPGTIRARSLSGKDGAIVLDGGDGGDGGAVRVSGTLDASGDASAGRIDISGQQVALQGAQLQASGGQHGGTVRVGGAYQGGHAQDGADRLPTLRNADTTSIDNASNIDVSSAQGSGGAAVVWSERNTVMQGAIDARGAHSGGKVEVSSASTVQSVALNRIALGRGGSLLLDPQDISIDDNQVADPVGNLDYSTGAGGATHLYTGDLTALLSTGASVTLKASQDISWNTFSANVTPAGAGNGGDLNLSAGRSIALSGLFNPGHGNWTLLANDRAANGVVNADRGAGEARMDLSMARVLNGDGGNLSLTLSDGAGNSNNTAGGIWLPDYTGAGLTARIAAGGTTDFGATPTIRLANVNTSGNITLDGNLRNQNGMTIINSANGSVSWTGERSGSTIGGEGALQFQQNGVATRYGVFSSFNDSVRAALGDGSGLGVSRIYGDANPDGAHLGQNLLHITAGSSTDAIADIQSALNFTVNGPGVTANAGGGYALNLSASANSGQRAPLTSNYFIDMATASIPLTISKRALTPTISSGSTTYGTAASVVSLANIVNGDSVAPVATRNGTGGIVLDSVGAGYGFDVRTGAGLSNFTLTGLSGAAAGNYTLNLGGAINGTLSVDRKTLTASTSGGNSIYGDAMGWVSYTLQGMLSGDDVTGQTALTSGGVAVTGTARVPVGTYAYAVTSLGGHDVANYQLASSGNSYSTFNVTPRTLNYSIDTVNTTYGVATGAGTVQLTNLLPGDNVVAGAAKVVIGGANLAGTSVTTRAGDYTITNSGFSGSDLGNYVLAGSNANMHVSTRMLSLNDILVTQTYGDTIVAPLLGIINGDHVFNAPFVLFADSYAAGSGSGSMPVGVYRISGRNGLSGPDAANYSLGYHGGITPDYSLSITPRAVTYSYSNYNAIYGNTVAPVAVLGNVVAGDVISLSAAASNGAGSQAVGATLGAGSYTLTGGVLSGNGVDPAQPASRRNYVLATSGNTTADITISPRTLSWTVGAGAAQYGDAATNAVTFGGMGLVGNDVVLPKVQALDSNGVALALPNVGNYSAGVTTLGGAAAGNYVLAGNGNTTGTLNVIPKQITFSFANPESTYGNLATPVMLSGFVGNDGAAAQLQVTVHRGQDSVVLTDRTPVGSYTVDASVASFSNPNYAMPSASNVNGVLTIKPRPITYDVGSATIVYGNTIPSTTATLNGVLSGDTVAAYASGNINNTILPVGQYPLGYNGTPLLYGRDAANYQVAGQNAAGMLTVTPKPLTYINLLDGGASYTYGTLTRLPQITTLLNGGVVDGDNVSLSPSSFNGLHLSSAGYLAAGTYAINPMYLVGAGASNYTLAADSQQDQLTITPVQLNFGYYVQAHGAKLDSQLYYGSTASVGLSATGLTPVTSLPGRRKDDLGASLVFMLPGGAATTLPDKLPAGAYNIVLQGLTGADAGNYAVNQLASPTLGNVIVAPRPISVDIAAQTTRTYGDLPGAIASTVLGALPGDDVQALMQATNSEKYQVTLSERSNVGNYTISTTGLTGADSRNYKLVTTATSWYDPLWNVNFSATPGKTGNLTINPRPLTISYSGPTTSTYQDLLTGTFTVTGMANGDTLPLQQQLAFGLSSPIDGVVGRVSVANERTNVGSYRYYINFMGDTSNYTYSKDITTLTIVPRTIAINIPDVSAVYLDTLPVRPRSTVTGLRQPEDLELPLEIIGANGKPIAPGDYSTTDVGVYQIQPVGLSKNYNLDTANSHYGKFTMNPTQIRVDAAAPSTLTYGTLLSFGSLEYWKPLAVMGSGAMGLSLNITGTGIPTTQLAALATPEGGAAQNQTLSQRLDVGDYSYQLTLGGDKAKNFTLVGTTGGNLTVTPKLLTYTVDNASGQYGNYKSCNGNNCYYWNPGIDLGTARLTGVQSGDTINGTVALLDTLGNPVVIDSKTAVGTYLEVVTGLTGDKVHNYRIAPGGSAPGLMQITPMWLSFATTSGIFLGGYGFAGTPGVPTLRGPDGAVLPNGDQVEGLVTAHDPSGRIVANLNQLMAGRYTFTVDGLTGKDAGNYRLIRFNSNGSYGANDVGTLDVYADTTLGLGLVQQVTLPPAPPPPPAPPIVKVPQSNTPTPEFNQIASIVPTSTPILTAQTQIGNSTVTVEASTSGVTVQAPALGMVADDGGIRFTSGSGTSGATDTTRPPTTTGASGDTNVGLTSVGVSGAAAAGAEGGASLGDNASISAQAQATIDALAKVGITGVTVTANASVHSDVELNFGPGYAAVGVQGDASVNITISRTGAHIVADASAGVNADVGVSDHVGGVGTVSGNVGAGAFVYARSDTQYGYANGRVTTTVDESVGVGARIGASGGVSGSVGSVEAGATLYSPGSVGIGFSWTGGYSDGAVTVGFDLGAKLGIGGLDLKLNFTIDPMAGMNAIANSSFASWLFSAFGGSTYDERETETNENNHGADLKNDPVTRFAFLKSHTNWQNAYKDQTDNKAFYANYQALLDRTAAVTKREADAQATFLDLLKTDPAKAVAYAHAGNLAQLNGAENDLTNNAKDMGVQLAVKDGKLAYVSISK